jgi:hypothetical protein
MAVDETTASIGRLKAADKERKIRMVIDVSVWKQAMGLDLQVLSASSR